MPLTLTLALLASAALLLVVVHLLVVPAWCVRASALSVTLAVVLTVGNNTAPRAVWVGAFALCVLLLAVAVLRAGLTRRPAQLPFVAVTAFWTWLAVSSVVEGTYSVQRLVAYFGVAVAVAFVTSQLTRREVHRVLGVFVVLAGVEVLVAVAELVTGAPLVWAGSSGARGNPFVGGALDRTQGTLGHPIVFALVQGLALLVTWADPWRLAPRLRAIALMVGAAGVLLSGTRSVAAVVVAAIAVHLLLRSRLATWLRNVGLAGVVGAIVLLLDLGLRDLVDELLDSGSWIHRLESVAAVPALLARPVEEALWGSGFGSEVSLFTDGHIRLTFGLPVVDNFFVYLLGTTGVLGLAAFLALGVVTFARGDRMARAVVVLFVGMGASFDLVVWIGVGVLMSFGFALPGAAALAPREPSEVRGRTDAAGGGRPGDARRADDDSAVVPEAVPVPVPVSGPVSVSIR